jgi:hypothetical protein
MLTKIKVDNMGIFSAMGSVFGRRNKRQDNSGMNDLTSRVSALEEALGTTRQSRLCVVFISHVNLRNLEL